MKQHMNVNVCACGIETETEKGGTGEGARVVNLVCACSGKGGLGGVRMQWAGLTVGKFHTLEEHTEQKQIPSYALPYFTHG